MDSGTELIRLAVFGAPVAHSLSPRIHGMFARQAGLEVSYEAFETRPGTLADSLAKFRARSGTGCNITLPLKGEAMALARDSSEAVRLAHAANTLIAIGASPTEGWRADNTDGCGLVRDLQAGGEFEPAGKRLAIAGAGGAAAGILAALLAEKPAATVLINRSPDKAVELAERHAEFGPVTVSDWPGAGGLAGLDLLINATSMGHAGQAPPLDPGMFTPGGACYDLNYGQPAAPLRQWCSQHGIRYRDGLGMLVEQAAESFRIWTGFTPDTQAVLRELRSSIA